MSRLIYGFEWDFLYIFDYETNFGIEGFRKMVDSSLDLSEYLENKMKSWLKKDSHYNSLSEKDKDKIYGDLINLEKTTIANIKIWSRYSMCLSIYAFFESRLKLLCEKIQHEFKFKLAIKDLPRNGDIDRYIIYLRKVFEIDIEGINSHLTKIKGQKRIRNIIAHNNGEVSEEEISKIQKCDGLVINQYNSIEITDSYLSSLLNNMCEFLTRILKPIDVRYSEIKSM